MFGCHKVKRLRCGDRLMGRDRCIRKFYVDLFPSPKNGMRYRQIQLLQSGLTFHKIKWEQVAFKKKHCDMSICGVWLVANHESTPISSVNSSQATCKFEEDGCRTVGQLGLSHVEAEDRTFVACHRHRFGVSQGMLGSLWKQLYHLESGWHNSHVLVYHGPLLSCAIYFHYGVGV